MSDEDLERNVDLELCKHMIDGYNVKDLIEYLSNIIEDIENNKDFDFWDLDKIDCNILTAYIYFRNKNIDVVIKLYDFYMTLNIISHYVDNANNKINVKIYKKMVVKLFNKIIELFKELPDIERNIFEKDMCILINNLK